MVQRKLKEVALCLALLFIAGTSFAFADPVITADAQPASCYIGDVISVKINVAQNTSMHGLYFDLSYDPDIFSFIDCAEGSLISQTNAGDPKASRFQYAVTSPTVSAITSGRVIVSWTLTDPDAFTKANGTFAELRFRVIGSTTAGEFARFTFNQSACGAYSHEREPLAKTSFIGSSNVTVKAGSVAYVQINTPGINEVLYKDTVDLSATSTAEDGYHYIIQNEDSTYISSPVSAAFGNVTGHSVPLVYGINRLQIQLRDNKKAVLATDRRIVYRSEAEKFVKIVNPVDHALVNADRVRILVASPFDTVSVNDVPGERLSEKWGGKNLYFVELWLKKGFNTVTAVAVSPGSDKLQYKDTISLYYQRDDASFRFVSPIANSTIKNTQTDPQLNDGSLNVRGEIGSTVKPGGNPNVVTLRVVYNPSNPAQKSRVLVRDRELTLYPNDSSGIASQAPYAFKNDFPIDVRDLENGTLELIAYKNKTATSCDAEIHRVVRLERNLLSIDLIQPNIFGTDILDTQQKFIVFNRGVAPKWGDVTLLKGGKIGLSHNTDDNSMGSVDVLGGRVVTDIIEAKDGTGYALVNESSTMRLFRKDPFTSDWKQIISTANMHGYTLCETDFGVLVGVSNMYASDNSGLYLLQDTTLINIRIGKPIPHVQFIENREGTVYLYGNDYSNVYAFNVFALHLNNGVYTTNAATSIPCDVEGFLRQAVFGTTQKTLLTVDDAGFLQVYQNPKGSGFSKVDFKESQLPSGKKFSAIIRGSYSQGTYDAYLLLPALPDDPPQVLMEQKSSGRLAMVPSYGGLAIEGENLLGATFSNDAFSLLYRTNQVVGTTHTYTIRKGSVLFDKFSLESIETFIGSSNLLPGPSNRYGLLALRGGSYLYGYSSDLRAQNGSKAPKIVELRKSYPAEGTISFLYDNRDVEYLKGFSFLAEPARIDSGEIRCSFALYDSEMNGSIIFESPGYSDDAPATVSKLLSRENAPYDVSRAYDAESGLDRVIVRFKNQEKNRYIGFKVSFSCTDRSSPRWISDLSVDKKTVVLLPDNGEQTLKLPIYGYVNDSTATQITIQEQDVPLDARGCFSYLYEINTARSSTDITLYCSNAAGESHQLDFSVNIFESRCGFDSDITLTDKNAIKLSASPKNPEELVTDENKVYLSGRFYGLEGAVVGYETYTCPSTGENPILIASGVFEPILDSVLHSDHADLGRGYVTGSIKDGMIPLIPGKQSLVVYVENPGGKRELYRISDKPVSVTYQLSEDQQSIEILNETEPLVPQVVSLGVPLNRQAIIQISESATRPLEYKQSYVVTGRVNSLYTFTEIKVKSVNGCAVFANGTKEIVVPVDKLNRFEVSVTLSIPEDKDAEDCAILLVPTIPALDWMRTGLMLCARKNYIGSRIIPDFSPMDAVNWKADEIKAFEKAVRVRISRHVPVGTRLVLRVNFEKDIVGTLERVGSTDMYRVLDDNGVEVKLSGLKSGRNRVQWQLSLNGTISASISGHKDMDDYFLDMEFPGLLTKTVIGFNINPRTYYGKATSGDMIKLPDMSISKQANTSIKVLLNGNSVVTDSTSNSLTISLLEHQNRLLEGRNDVQVLSREKNGTELTFDYVFHFDSKPPVVNFLDYEYSTESPKFLSRLSVIVQEANLKHIELRQTHSGSQSLVPSSANHVITDLGNHAYRVEWNDLSLLEPTLRPSKEEPLSVYVYDYAGNTSISADFLGLANYPNPAEFKIQPLILGSSEGPLLEGTKDNWDYGGFTNRLKIFSRDMTYVNLSIPTNTTYTIKRPGKITIESMSQGPSSGQVLNLVSGTGASMDRGFKIAQGAMLKVPKPTSIDSSPMYAFQPNEKSGQHSISFWFRNERESIYKADTDYKRILTFARGTYKYGDNKNLDYELYLAYREANPVAQGTENIAVIEKFIFEGKTYTAALLEKENMLERSGKDGWNLITVSLDNYIKDNELLKPRTTVLQLSVNLHEPITFDFGSNKECMQLCKEITDEIRKGYHEQIRMDLFENRNLPVFIFGNTNGSGILRNKYFDDHSIEQTPEEETTVDNTSENGHFSIARAFINNTLLTNFDVIANSAQIIKSFENDKHVPPTDFTPVHYTFNGINVVSKKPTAVRQFGNGYLELRAPSKEIDDYYTRLENAEYKEIAESLLGIPGALIATPLRQNRLKVGNNAIMFADSTSAFKDNLNDPSFQEEWLLLQPALIGRPGKYSFANNFGSHGVMFNRNYSVYGEAAPLTSSDPLDATLVLSINGREKRYPIKPGKFHFVYPNEAMTSPTKVVMYVETTTGLRLSKTMFFTEGDYRLPEEASAGLRASNAKTKYLYRKAGSISFWYKPMIANRDGFVDYDVTLLDSEWARIYAVPGGDNGHACLSVELKGERDPDLDSTYRLMREIHTTVPLREGWQYIQFTWDRSGEDHVAYLYVNGMVAGKLELKKLDNVILPLAKSMRGIIQQTDNTWFGSNEGMSNFACGYLDNIRMDNSYKLSDYSPNDPLEISYTDGFGNLDSDKTDACLSITATNIAVTSIKNLSLVLTNEAGQVVLSKDYGSPVVLDKIKLTSYEPGLYRAYVTARINGFRFEKTLRFVKNDRPQIKLMASTPLIVANEETTLHFDFAYHTANLLEKDLNRYSGLELILQGTDEGQGFTRRYYVVQDFTTYDHNDKWLLFSPENGHTAEDFPVENSRLAIEVPRVRSSTDIGWTYRPFYYTERFDPLPLPKEDSEFKHDWFIPTAGLEITQEPSVGRAYRLMLKLAGQDLYSADNLDDFTISWSVRSKEGNGSASSVNPLTFTSNGSIFLYYDDMLKQLKYGDFTCSLSLFYKQQLIKTYVRDISWSFDEEDADNDGPMGDKSLAITELSVVRIVSNESNKAMEYAADLFYSIDEQNVYDLKNNTVILWYELRSYERDGQGRYSKKLLETKEIDGTRSFGIIEGVPIKAENSIVELTVYERRLDETTEQYTRGIESTKELTILNRVDPPQVVLTSSVPSRIAYNNVKFSWIGYYHDDFNENITYSYNLDSQGWSSKSADWRTAEYYSLKDGYHKFSVRAYYGNNNVSPDANAIFYVDVTRPVIDATKVAVEKIRDQYGFVYAVNLRGGPGSVVEDNLELLSINGKPIAYNKASGFVADNIPITVDGINTILISAYDIVGNYAEAKIAVDNAITELIYPTNGETVRFTPVTLVGKLPSKINTLVDIYVRDPLVQRGADNDYSGWRKARMNEDFTFFVDDLTVNPGTAARETGTEYEMAVVSKSGHAFTKTITVRANEVIHPIDLDLSTHAAEGEQAETEVTISARANVSGISSWSIDYTGDGIYDEISIADDPAKAQTREWTHTYSTLGVVSPRVRVITKNGAYFSVNDTLVIHEKIKEASNKAVTNPLAMAMTCMEDLSQRVFILAGEKGNHRVEVYEIGRNDSYVSNKLYQIPLTALGILNPVKLAAVNASTLIVADNKEAGAIVHTLKADEFDVFSVVPSASVSLADTVSDIDTDGQGLFITTKRDNAVWHIAFKSGLPNPVTIARRVVTIPNGIPAGFGMGVTKDDYGLLLADFDRQRVIRLSDAFTTLEYMGSQGSGEGEFIKPSIVRSFQNRMFIYDEARRDIQAFDPAFKPVTRIMYDPALKGGNYLDPAFLNGVVGLSSFAREESNRLYYYAVILSKSSNKLAVLRLPQWEEMRARTRNNKIIFLKDGEVFSAKPTGSDLARLISTDSIPRISGSVDYPALSPDGKTIAFTSRAKLYDGSGKTTEGSSYAYDNLYVMNTDGTGLERIPLAELRNFEIERPQFNSNGTTLIFSAKPMGGFWQIYQYSFESGSISRLFTSDENARYPYFSPDDRFIAFATDYDGDQDIHIYDTLNPSVRVVVTNNSSRDAYPVWGVVYPGEIANSEHKIESKIAFVSERKEHKGIHYAYIARPSESDIRVVMPNGDQVGSNPDSAAIEITGASTDKVATGAPSEGDYPSFTGDGTAVVYEHFNGSRDSLIRYDFASKKTEEIRIANGSRRPAGMKNMITEFDAEVIDGNSIKLSWNRYTDTDIFYTVRFKQNGSTSPHVEKRVFTQNGTIMTGLDMGMDYLFQVAIVENGEDAAKTQWTKVSVPEVVARPSYKIDEGNPYLVTLKAWTPKEDTNWGFSWIIDNQEIPAQTGREMPYQFGTSGVKTVILKAHNRANTYTSFSSPMTITIVSDIKPIIEYVLSSDRKSIQLSAAESLGKSIDWSSAAWTLTGPGLAEQKTLTGVKSIGNIAQFSNKLNVNLRLSRVPVTGQPATDTIESNVVIDLDYEGTKVVVTQEADKANQRLITFSGANSIGNLNWREARWTIFRDGQVQYQTSGISSFAYEFPETNAETRYSVSLSVPSMNDSNTYTVNNIVSVVATPIVPEIDYEIVELKNEEGRTQGAKIIFSATNSKGNNIDYAQAKWTVPVAGTFGEQPTQVGPTAVYNLFNTGSTSQVQVSLTLMRRGGTEAITATKLINLDGSRVAKPVVRVNPQLKETSSGMACLLDVLSSSGPNIDWERTQWQFSVKVSGNAQSITATGPTANVQIPADAEKTVIQYTVTLYLMGEQAPLVKADTILLDAMEITPVISEPERQGSNGNVFTLSVADTPAVNVDWERTTWYFHDGNETVSMKYGATVTHAFVRKDKAMGYPVVVEMFFKNSSRPFTGYRSIQIDGDVLQPVITWDRSNALAGDEVLFTADKSTGTGIEWSQAKWTFGDGTAPQYGASASHKYMTTDKNETYKVSLTLTRRLGNGESETKTDVREVNVNSDKVKPVVHAKLHADGYLVLDCSSSEGRGLLLDRSVWMFAGKGDSENINISQQTGTSSGVSASSSFSTKVTTGVASYLTGGIINTLDISTQDSDTTTKSDSLSLSSTDSFSNENYHVGMTARRWVDEYDIYRAAYDTQKTITVSLNVYRQDPNGGIKGQVITVIVNLSAAAKDEGVTYQ